MLQVMVDILSNIPFYIFLDKNFFLTDSQHSYYHLLHFYHYMLNYHNWMLRSTDILYFYFGLLFRVLNLVFSHFVQSSRLKIRQYLLFG